MDITASEAARRIGVTKAATSEWALAGRFAAAWKDSYTGAWHIPEESVEAVRQARERGDSDAKDSRTAA